MDKIKKLFDVITRDGYYDKSFEEFQVQFQDEEYQTKVFDVVTRDGLFDKTFEEFKGMYVPVVEKKKPKRYYFGFSIGRWWIGAIRY